MDADFSDQTEQALVKKPRPVGWFIAGLVTIASVTGFAAYHLPLQSAHAKLAGEHKALAKKAGELDHSLKTDRKTLASTEVRREALQKFIDRGVEVEKVRAGAFGILQTTVERNLGAFIKAKLLEIEVEPSGVVLKFQEKALFRPRTSLAAPAGMKTLCQATGALAVANDWDVLVTTRAPSDDKNYWEVASERAALLGQALEKRCEISNDRIKVSVDRPSEAVGLPAAEIAFALHESKDFVASEAPIGSVEPSDGEPAEEQEPTE